MLLTPPKLYLPYSQVYHYCMFDKSIPVIIFTQLRARLMHLLIHTPEPRPFGTHAIVYVKLDWCLISSKIDKIP